MRGTHGRSAFLLGVLGLFFGVFAPFAVVRGWRAAQRGDPWALAGVAAGLLGSAAMLLGIGYWLYAASP